MIVIFSGRTTKHSSLKPIDSTMDTSTPHQSEYKHDLHQGLVPYQPRKGLGIQISLDPLHSVYVNDNGDAARFNEPKNEYGQYLLSLCFAAHRDRTIKAEQAKRNNTKAPTGEERMILDETFRQESIRLTEAACFQSETFNSKHRNYLHTIMRDFNKPIPDKIGNRALERIMLRYFQIRLGFDPYDLDEFEAAMKAIQLDYISRRETTKCEGEGPWTLPIVHLLNGHLLHREYKPITFRTDYDDDQEFSVPLRKEHSRKTFIDGETAQVETREDEREKMHLALRELNSMYTEFPEETDIPAETETVEDVMSPVKRRVTLQSKTRAKRARRA